MQMKRTKMNNFGRIFFTVGLILSVIIFNNPGGRLTAADKPPRDFLDKLPEQLARQFEPGHRLAALPQKPAGLLTPGQWAALIDSAWGPGLSWLEHLAIWNTFWSNIDDDFAGFEGLDSNIWQDVVNRYYPEILDTVSRGRLSAIVNHSCRVLRDGHTQAGDEYVSYSALEPGLPLMVNNAWGGNDHFGAGLTVMPDSTLLVYKVAPNHPLDLVPGDLILGYHGVPWSQLYKDLLEAELPLTGGWYGGPEESHSHAFHICAGMNWHLFDTIDVVKYSTGDTLHLPTSLMHGYNASCWATEQVPVQGVPMPDIFQGELTSWGIIEGTNIGYIYSLGWIPAADSAYIVNTWMTALDSLQYHYNVSGVILDFRTNFGTNFSFQKVLNRIFESQDHFLEVDIRCGAHYVFCRYPYFESWFHINGHLDPNHWDKSIAILTGPGAISGGDFYPMILSRHPYARVFGKPTTGAFGGMTYPELHPGWYQVVGNTNAYIADNPDVHLMRAKFPGGEEFPWVDYEYVWLTREGVSEGRDDVVEAAVAWISSLDTDTDGVLDENDNCPDDYNPEQTDSDGDGIGDVCDYSCGDTDNNGTVNLLDITFLISYLYMDGPEPQNMQAADPDGSGIINLLDITYLIAFLYKSGPEPICS